MYLIKKLISGRQFLTHSITMFFLLSCTSPQQQGKIPIQTEGLALDVKQASKLAASLANKEAKKRRGIEPFSSQQTNAVFKNNRWNWNQIIAFGNGDLEAKVTFSKDGSNEKVDVDLISIGVFSPPPE